MPGEKPAATHLFRAETPPPHGKTWSLLTTAEQLPGDMVERAVSRLGWLALFYAISFPVFRLTDNWENPAAAFRASPYPLVDIAYIGAALAGALVCALVWSRRIPGHLMLDFGLIFEVIGAVWIGIFEHAMPENIGVPFRGVSAISLWIVVFVLVIPTSLGKNILAASGAALMGPLGLVTSILYYRMELPPLGQWIQLFFHIFMFAGFAVMLSRFVYRLGMDVGRAREMGSYRLLERIGSGGMGEVWKAQHRLLARPSAIKVIHSDVCSRSDAQAGTLHRRFEREVQATAALRSPHTVAVYDFGSTPDGCFYYVMELLDGFDLEALVERFGPQPPERVVQMLLQACDSLAEAHANGLIHRDVKPKNIFLCRLGLNYDFIKVLDFGLVKSSNMKEQFQSNLTMDGSTTGTPAYMSPELALGDRNVDSRSDIYSLGCVAYWLLTGQLLFQASGPVAVLLAHIQSPPVPPSQRSELPIPEDLERVILSCLEKDPGRRPQSAQELARQLAACRLPAAWDAPRAETWWLTHLPALSAPDPVIASARSS